MINMKIPAYPGRERSLFPPLPLPLLSIVELNKCRINTIVYQWKIADCFLPAPPTLIDLA